MTVKCSPFGPKPQFEDGNGNPAVNYTLGFFAATSSTPQNTYTDSGGGSANANPLTLNSLGQPPNEIWFTSGLSYKAVLKDASGVVVWTIDNLSGINDTTSSQDEWVAFTGAPTFVSTTSFTVAGDQTGIFTIGRRVKTTNSGGTVYSTIISSVFGASTAVGLKNDSSVLDSGLSAVSYGIISASHPSVAAATINAQPVCNGRLTLETGVPVSTSDQTAKTSVFFTPYKGNTVDLYDGSANWNRYTFQELTLAVPASTSQMYDVFLQNNAGTLQLNAVAWTNDTTRATALTTQNGVLVKTGSTGQLYLGSFRTTTVSGQTEDSLAKRYVWNYYNRARRPMKVVDVTNTWTYTTANYQQANASAVNQLDCVIGVSEDAVFAQAQGALSNASAAIAGTGIGIDSTTSNSATLYQTVNALPSNIQHTHAIYRGFPGVGRHTIVWLEFSSAVGSTTWYGDNGSTNLQTGIIGEING